VGGESLRMIEEDTAIDTLAHMLLEMLRHSKKKADMLESILRDMREKNISFRDRVIERTLEIAAGREIPTSTGRYADENILVDLFAKILDEIIDFYLPKQRNEVIELWLRYFRMKGFSKVFVNEIEQKIKS